MYHNDESKHIPGLLLVVIRMLRIVMARLHYIMSPPARRLCLLILLNNFFTVALMLVSGETTVPLILKNKFVRTLVALNGAFGTFIN